MIVSPLLIEEISEVLTRPKFTRWADQGRGAAYVAAFAVRSEFHADPAIGPDPNLRDPEDEYLLALARSANADVLVSVDRDLLDAQITRVS